MSDLSVVLMQTTLSGQTDNDLISSDDLYTGVCKSIGREVPRESVQYINGTADVEGMIEIPEFFEALSNKDVAEMKSVLPSGVTEFFEKFEARTQQVFNNATADTVIVFVIYNTSLLESTIAMLNTLMTDQSAANS